jgi:membrane protein implicated in regulation of membrane protease activity
LNPRSILFFAVGCITSPCCTPLIVPIIIALLAGTPAALWISDHLGWVYGGLTLISVVSFALAWRWQKTRKPVQPTSNTFISPTEIPVISDSGRS